MRISHSTQVMRYFLFLLSNNVDFPTVSSDEMNQYTSFIIKRIDMRYIFMVHLWLNF